MAGENPLEVVLDQANIEAVNTLAGVFSGNGRMANPATGRPAVTTTTPHPDDDLPVHVAMTILDTTLDPHAVTFIRPPR